MSTVSYDLDTSGGLMPLIRALIKPPDEDVNVQKPKKPQHPYYKRPGKGHNHDSCDACGEGGDLICCDRCPASFHLGCYDPPLDEDDIPAGLWLCRECHASDEKASSSRSSRPQSPTDSKSDSEKKTRSLRNRANSRRSKSRDGEETKEPEKELTPMEVLVRAARIMNPRQFDLPNEMKFNIMFPGTEKEPSKNGNPSLVTVDAWGCVPLPAKSCYVCEGTCKAAPLLQCDYCPLLFHQDCLDPPLTALPTGRWMCPNHVEQYIDWKLVNSISATERVALWEKFSGPVDPHTIKLDFIRRARNKAPCFREKIPLEDRSRVKVPEMVKHHYRCPPPLLPSRREHVRCNNVLKRLKMDPDYDASEEDDQAPKHQICMNLQCPAYSNTVCQQQKEQKEQQIPALKGASHEDASRDLDAISAPKLEARTDDSSELSDSDLEYLTASIKRHKSPSRRRAKVSLLAGEETESLLAAVDEQLHKLDQRLVKLLAWQRLQQVLVGERCYGPWREAALSGAAADAVLRSVDRSKLAKLGFRHVALPSEMLSRLDRDKIATSVWGQPPSPSSPPQASPPHAPHVPARAALCEVLRPAKCGLGDGIGQPIPMRLSSLTIGTDSGCDVRLSKSGCRALSRHHAVIFMDEVTRHFELINYSEWGSVVNGVMYACDATLPCGARAEGAEGGEEGGARGAAAEPDAEARASAVREIVRARGGNYKPIKQSTEKFSCGCRAPTAAAWEGSALVPHGALLQFGCALYVFSIIPEVQGDPAI